MAKVFNIGGNTISYGGFLLRELGSGSLTISKTVSGSGFDPTKTFELTVVFSAPVTYNGTTSTTHTFNLAHGQSVTITDIPELTTYEVTETPLSPQDIEAGYSISGMTGGSGKIGNASAITAVAANGYITPVGAKTIRIQFEDPNFTPLDSGLNWSSTVSWSQVSSTPNIWDCTNTSSDWQSATFGTSWCSDMGDFRVLQMNATGVVYIDHTFNNSGILSIENVRGTSGVTEMDGMFHGCSKLTSVPLFDTSNVTTMHDMFGACVMLESVPLFDTHNVTSMSSMFQNCSMLESVPLFDTSNVTDMSFMFADCSLLEQAPLFNTGKVTKMNQMFLNCGSLKNIPLFDTTRVTNVINMFMNCYKVESGALDLYEQLAYQTTPPSSHSQCFRYCGRDTTTGAAELAQIPSDWK